MSLARDVSRSLWRVARERAAHGPRHDEWSFVHEVAADVMREGARASTAADFPGLRAFVDRQAPPAPSTLRFRLIPEVVGGVSTVRFRPRLGATKRTILFLHGGGYVFGSLKTHGELCATTAIAARASAVFVDYRLAPEHPWPAAVDDAVTAARWASSWLAAGEPVAIGGDSAGGCIAALAALRLRDEGAALRAQILLCPNTDLTGAQPSMTEKATGFGLEADTVRAAARLWMPVHARRALGDVSPLFAPSLEGLPPTLLVTAEHDPLRDEGNAYANRLLHAAVELTHRTEPALSHGFYLDATATAEAATHRLLADMKSLLHL